MILYWVHYLMSCQYKARGYKGILSVTSSDIQKVQRFPQVLFKQEYFLKAAIFQYQNKSNIKIIVYLKMATSTCELISDLRTHLTFDKPYHPGPSSPGPKPEANCEKHIISNQNGDDDLLDEESIKKKNQSKQKYRRLKQKLTSLCCEHQEKSLFKSNKQVSSSNRSRLLTLAIQFEKMTLNQTKDYPAIETKLKQIHKILDLKWENDLSILKQSRFIPAFSALLKKVPTFHKNQFFQSVKTIELGLRVLRIFSTASANRDYMISTNQLSTLNSCLSSFIGKEEKKLAIECFNVLFELLCGKIKADSEQIANITLQIVFFGQLARKLRQTIDNCITEQGAYEEQYVIKCLKYLYIIYRKCFQKYLERPIYQQPQIPQIMQFHLDALLTQLEHLLPTLLYDRQANTLKQEQLPVCIINMSLYILKLINLCIHVNCRAAQKVIELKEKNPFCETFKNLYHYARQSIEQSDQNNQIHGIYSQIIDFLGKICCECQQNRKALCTTGLLQMLYNHPIVYIMDHKLKCLLIPSLCSVMNQSETNMKKYLSQNSAESIITYVLAQKKRYEQTQYIQKKQLQQQTMREIDGLDIEEIEGEDMGQIRLARKQSVSSLNSYTTQCTQNSYFNSSEEDRYVTGLFFLVPYAKWEPLIQMLRSLDN